MTISDCDKQHSQLDGCRGEIELSVWFFYREEGENLETVGRHGLFQAHRDEAGGGGLNEDDAVAATKIIFIVMREKSYVWVDEFQIKVILS